MAVLTNGYVMRYYEDCFTLVKTMIVKYEAQALLMNERVALQYGEAAVNADDPDSWKYYMNVCGEYHPTDTIMRVISIDTLEEIVFTVENLRIHSATREAYQYGTRHYYALIRDYPTQELLISGILNPANKAKAIEAKDGSIISYRKDLVESNEMTLISELETFLQRHIERWYIQQFSLSQELYHVVQAAGTVGEALAKLINLRSKRCHTYEVHSFHVRMYLASHGELDRYLPFMTLKQALWFYREIRYLERHSGRRDQFDRLIKKVLTDRGIPLGEYNVHQQDTFTNYLSDTKAVSNPLNAITNFLQDPNLSVKDLFEKESTDAPGNVKYLTSNLDTQDARFNYFEDNRVKTKVLHSTMVDLSNAVPETYEDIAMRQWCQMSMTGMYPAYVTFQDPKTGVLHTLSAKDSFLYIFYLTMKQNSVTLDQFPAYLNLRYRRHPKPTVEDLLSVTDQVFYDFRPMAEEIIRRQPSLTQCLSVDSFNKLVYQLYDESFWHWMLQSAENDYYGRAQVENMVNRLYANQLTPMNSGYDSIGAWVAGMNLPAYNLTVDEADALIKVVFEAGAGIKIDNTRSVKNIQRAMIELLKELSSYTIQFIREINDEDIILVDWPAVRTADPAVSMEDYLDIPVEVILLDAKAKGEIDVSRYDSETEGIQTDLTINAVPIEYAVSAYSDPVMDANLDLYETIEVTKTYSEISAVVDGIVCDPFSDVIGLELFEQLPESAKQTVRSIYRGA